MEKYERKHCEPRKLLWPEYQVFLDVLKGEHHALLEGTVREPALGNELESAGITDLSTLSPEDLRGVTLNVQGPDEQQSIFHCEKPGLLAEIESNQRRFFYLRIDLNYPPTVIKEALDSLLTSRYKKFEKIRKKLTQDQKKVVAAQIRREMPWKVPFHVEPWLKYLKCYDLKKARNHSNNEIGEIVYCKRNDLSRKRVLVAIRAVKALIHKAENYLPPFDVFGPPESLSKPPHRSHLDSSSS